MQRKKLDARIPTLISNSIQKHHRSFFVIIGDKGRDQVVTLHFLLSKARVSARPSVLWCYKKELGFSSHRQKRMKQIKKQIARGTKDPDQDDPFELFVSSTQIRYTYYKETQKILGNTYGMCVLQDFEALTPNLLARTIETVEGGGAVVILLKTMDSLKRLYTMTMDVHSRYRTESSVDPVARFNERFLLSLGPCETCLVVDDELNVLPISIGKNVKPLPPKDDTDTPEEKELKELKASLADTQPVGSLVACARTLDQARAILTFVDGIAEKSLRSTVTLTASRGRGKSAALGIAIAAAVSFGYSNIFITSPSPENLKTLFEFVFKGFDALGYEEHMDYDIVQSTNPEFQKAVVRVNIFRNHRQTIQYIQPTDHTVLAQAELLVIDEAAAIPLPVVRNLLGPYLVFMASTINGYEGTGRSLSLKLIQQLREQSRGFGGQGSDQVVVNREGKERKDGSGADMASATTGTPMSVGGRVLREIKLETPIRYGAKDPVETWLNKLLCLDCSNAVSRSVGSGCPSPASCELYYVNRDTLFSFHPVSETFLQKMMGLYVASHYKNSPNDLQLLSDAPGHMLFVLLPPVTAGSNGETFLPEPLCVVQVALEGSIAKGTALAALRKGIRRDGDLIPWVVTQQFQEDDFASLSGARVVRIATHPDYLGMGYGARALELLERYFQGQMTSLGEETSEEIEEEVRKANDDELEQGNLLTEQISVRDPTTMPPLFLKLTERRLKEHLHWLGVSYGITQPLLRFWKRSGYSPVYLRQTQNELTGEHTCIMLKQIKRDGEDEEDIEVRAGSSHWLGSFVVDFRRRFMELLGYAGFRQFSPLMVLMLLEAAEFVIPKHSGSLSESASMEMVSGPLRSRKGIHSVFTPHDLKRLDSYSQNLLDYHVVMDLVPTLSRLYFLNRLDAGSLIVGGGEGIAAGGGKAVKLTPVMAAIFVGIGFQHKTLEDVAKDLDLPVSQIMALFGKAIKRCSQYFEATIEREFEREVDKSSKGRAKKKESNKAVSADDDDMEVDEEDVVESEESDEEEDDAVEKGSRKRKLDDEAAWDPDPETRDLDAELSKAGREVVDHLKKRQKELLDRIDLTKYVTTNCELNVGPDLLSHRFAINSNEDDWADVSLNVKKKASGVVSVKGGASDKKAKRGGKGASEETAAQMVEKLRGEKSGIVDPRAMAGMAPVSKKKLKKK
ncbi:GNAT acetyltransferase 2-domain-containing protein [Cladochytrium replicatum]|nr:GNAT acetyltransferase 2-domain-containing protein [Cladochytrium replicatum]